MTNVEVLYITCRLLLYMSAEKHFLFFFQCNPKPYVISSRLYILALYQLCATFSVSISVINPQIA